MPPARIAVVTTGGTISMRPDPASGKLVPAANGEELVEMLQMEEAPPVELHDFAHVPSFDVHGELALDLAHLVRDIVSDGYPVVVTHGTDTMEETVYLIDLMLTADERLPPVVLTGAQRGVSEPDTDGPRNFREAIRVAAAREARARGAMICFAGEIHAAREVRKVHTTAVRAFGSPGYGPIGVVDGDRVVFHRRPDRRWSTVVTPGPLPRVDLIRLYAGADSVFLRASLEAGARAIVLECTGRGNANEQVVPGVREAIEAGVPVVVCSRCQAGRVEPVYGRGGGKDLSEVGALFAGDLAGPKARVLLQLALKAGQDPAEALAAEAG